MPRIDIFQWSAAWQKLAEDYYVFVISRIWRAGSGILPDDQRQRLKEFCGKLRLPAPEWEPGNEIQGFDRIEYWDIRKKLKAKGWILWLTGIFGEEPQSLAKILWNKSRQQLEDIELETEVVVGYW
jgi:hypothetical protein